MAEILMTTEEIQKNGEDPTPTPEELKEEEEALAEPKHDELRSSVVEKYGLDEDTQSDLIDKLAGDLAEQRKAFGKAVAQKRRWRESAQSANPTEPQTKTPQDTQPESQQPQDVESTVRNVLEKERLADMNLPDDVKSEVRTLAQVKGISVKQAAQDPYIQHLQSQHEQQERVEAAGISRTQKGASVADPSQPLDPSEYDLTTEEGRKAWDEAKAARRKQ